METGSVQYRLVSYVCPLSDDGGPRAVWTPAAGNSSPGKTVSPLSLTRLGAGTQLIEHIGKITCREAGMYSKPGHELTISVEKVTTAGQVSLSNKTLPDW